MLALVQPIDREACEAFEVEARRCIRNQQDWPVLAAALALAWPIWTEDAHFFGSGIANRTSATVSLYLDRPQ